MRIEFKISICLNGILSYNLVIENYAFHRVKKNFSIHQIFSIYMQKTNWTRKWISHFIFLKWKSLGMENKSTSAIKLKKKSNYQKKISGRLVGISHTFNTNTKFLSNFPYISNIWSNFYNLMCQNWLFYAYKSSLPITVLSDKSTNGFI